MTELDGALGILPASSGRLMAVIGDAASGPFNQPAAFARVRDVVTNFVAGRAVEAVAYAIERYGRPVIIVRTAANVAATNGAPVITATGTSVPSIHAATFANDDYEIVLKSVVGGTIGTAGITLRYSLDGGRSYSPAVALGTATFFVVPGAGTFRVDFAAGTVTANEVLISCPTTGPSWDATALGTAIDALGSSKQPWEFFQVAGSVVGADVDAIDAKLASMHNNGKHHFAVCNFRMPNVGESDATYQAAFNTAFGSRASTNVDVQAGAAKILSSETSGRQYRRHIAFAVAALYSDLSAEEDAAAIQFGPLPGVQIRDANGNLDEHDEFEMPGLDDMRATTLRTWNNREGVFVNNPRLLAPAGSDFVRVPYRRVMNIAREAIQEYLERRTSVPIRVNLKTGFILESEANDIEIVANATLATALLTRPFASGASFKLSRTDNVLSTSTLTYEIRIVALGYPKTITGTIGFNNPALRLSA